jgi:hypothetical protein
MASCGYSISWFVEFYQIVVRGNYENPTNDAKGEDE